MNNNNNNKGKNNNNLNIKLYVNYTPNVGNMIHSFTSIIGNHF